MEETRSTLLVRLRDRSDEEAWQTFDELYRPLLVKYAGSRRRDGGVVLPAKQTGTAPRSRLGEPDDLLPNGPG